MLTEAQKEQWIELLESGKYKKGVGALYSNGRYCCLGVLWYGVLGNEIENGDTDAGKHYEYLPFTVPDRLWLLNDSKEDWSEIIDYIKQELDCEP